MTGLVEIGPHRLRVCTTGDFRAQRPLLLVNGIGATMDLFEPLRAELGARPTIAFDAPGVGGSSTPLLPLPMSSLADLVARLLDHLEVGEVDVLGLSWGGALAQGLAHRHPGRVGSVVLAATMHGFTAVPGDPLALAVLATPWRYYSTRYLEAVAPVLYGPDVREHGDLFRRHAYLRSTKRPSALGYLWQLAAVATWTSLPWLGRLAQPTLVLAGDRDPVVPLVNARTMARLIPRGRLHVVEGGGHLFLYLQAADCAAVIDPFLGEAAAHPFAGISAGA
ncbi:MAG: alpha/beta fold hydrolase [Acidimicrobiia bacterium]|nr:alpha/beta fold hydrolase [Acidimicrobiia bacterium]